MKMGNQTNSPEKDLEEILGSIKVVDKLSDIDNSSDDSFKEEPLDLDDLKKAGNIAFENDEPEIARHFYDKFQNAGGRDIDSAKNYFELFMKDELYEDALRQAELSFDRFDPKSYERIGRVSRILGKTEYSKAHYVTALKVGFGMKSCGRTVDDSETKEQYFIDSKAGLLEILREEMSGRENRNDASKIIEIEIDNDRFLAKYLFDKFENSVGIDLTNAKKSFESCMNEGLYEEALYQAELAIDISNPESYERVGRAARLLGKTEYAKGHYETAIKMGLGMIFPVMTNDKIEIKDEYYTNAKKSLLDILRVESDTTKAEKFFVKMKVLKIDNERFLENIGYADFEKGLYDDAFKTFNNLIHCANNVKKNSSFYFRDSNYHRFVGKVFGSIDCEEEKKQHYEVANFLNGDIIEVKEELAKHYENHDNYDQALSFLKQLVVLDPTNMDRYEKYHSLLVKKESEDVHLDKQSIGDIVDLAAKDGEDWSFLYKSLDAHRESDNLKAKMSIVDISKVSDSYATRFVLNDNKTVLDKDRIGEKVEIDESLYEGFKC